MNWKKQFRALELNKEWDFAIELLENVIKENPDDLDAYLSRNYLLMNLLVEEEYVSNHDYYENLLKKYFDESYAKFSDNAEYLYYTGRTAYMSEWFFGIETEDAYAMLQKAMHLEPENLVYKWSYIIELDVNNIQQKKELCEYTKIVLQNDSPIKKILEFKGSLGEYIFDMMVNWSNRIQC